MTKSEEEMKKREENAIAIFSIVLVALLLLIEYIGA